VDGKSAVSASSTVSRAAGRLVATASAGPDKGRIPGKFLAGVALTEPFAGNVAVADNQTGAPISLTSAPGIGSLTASCVDQSNAPGVEDPQTVLTLDNATSNVINTAKRLGGAGAQVVAHAPGTVQTLTVNGSTNFEFHVQNRDEQIIISGIVRQDGRGTGNAQCLFYGTTLRIS
ncbi:MAG TPA: hypothetical protein VHF23_08290, partial [Gaiellaceae bacterium]|nr:hypothetical protein [Gaiellaceae bacterium]